MANNTTTTTAPTPGDTKKGYVFTEQGTWAPTEPPKKKHTVRNVFLAIFALSILGVGGCMAMVAGAANEVSKSIESDANKAGGTDNPLAITEGKAFEVDGFNYAAGWKITGDGLGSPTVKKLKVTNDRKEKDSAQVEIKLWKGTEVKALIDCSTDPIDVGSTVELSCTSADMPPKNFEKITINDSF